MEEWKSVLRGAMKNAMRSRQANVVAVMRETLAALENAEAPPTSEAPIATQGDGPIAGSVAGLGAGEVARLKLTPEAAAATIDGELDELKKAISDALIVGENETAQVLRTKLDALIALR